MIPQQSLTREKFTQLFRASAEKRFRESPAKGISTNAKVPIEVAKEWLDGTSIPPPNKLNLLIPVMHDIQHLRPAYRELHNREQLLAAKASAPPAPISETQIQLAGGQKQTLVQYKRPERLLSVVPNPPPGSGEVEKKEAPSGKEEAWGDRLRRLRLAAGMTDKDLAGLLKVTRSSINFWEQGAIKPTGERWQGLVDLFPELRSVLPRGRETQKPGRKSKMEEVVAAPPPPVPTQPKAKEPVQEEPKMDQQPDKNVSRQKQPKLKTAATSITSAMDWIEVLGRLKNDLPALNEMFVLAARDGLDLDGLKAIVTRFVERQRR